MAIPERAVSRGRRAPGQAPVEETIVMLCRVPDYRPMTSHLTTERLRLRPWAESDVDEYRTLVTERGNGVPTVENIRERITVQLAATTLTGIALVPIQRRVEGDFIGYYGLIVGRASIDEPEIAYELFQCAHGRGYATEAARAVLDAAIATGRARLWSTVGSWNTPSLRVLERLGFERDHVTTKDDGSEVVWLTRVLP
jgi:RimJ/RimL family protein N-acetyltransferase